MTVVTARMFFKKDKLKEADSLLKELIVKTNQEDGCIEYEAYLNCNSSDDIVIIEKWQSDESLEAHGKTKHFTEILPKIREFFRSEPEISIYKAFV